MQQEFKMVVDGGNLTARYAECRYNTMHNAHQRGCTRRMFSVNGENWRERKRERKKMLVCTVHEDMTNELCKGKTCFHLINEAISRCSVVLHALFSLSLSAGGADG